MAEEFTSITEARKLLPRLSQTVQRGGERYIITNQGEPQAVLLGYKDYKGLLAAVELLNRPRDLRNLEEGLAQTERLSSDQLRTNLAARRKSPVAREDRIDAAYVDVEIPALYAIRAELQRIVERIGSVKTTHYNVSTGTPVRVKGSGEVKRAGIAHAASELRSRNR